MQLYQMNNWRTQYREGGTVMLGATPHSTLMPSSSHQSATRRSILGLRVTAHSRFLTIVHVETFEASGRSYVLATHSNVARIWDECVPEKLCKFVP